MTVYERKWRGKRGRESSLICSTCVVLVKRGKDPSILIREQLEYNNRLASQELSDKQGAFT